MRAGLAAIALAMASADLLTTGSFSSKADDFTDKLIPCYCSGPNNGYGCNHYAADGLCWVCADDPSTPAGSSCPDKKWQKCTGCTDTWSPM